MAISNINLSSFDVYSRPQLPKASTKALVPGSQLSEAEQKQLAELKKIDAEVRRHEQAHKAAAAGISVSGPHFQFVTGPDGKKYAVAGEVKIDTSKVPNDPEATIRKARQIRKAALAPQNPSSQDRRVAAEATRMEFEARMELAKKKQEGTQLYNQFGESVVITSYSSGVDIYA